MRDLEPKNDAPLKLFTIKGAKTYMKTILMVFPKNFSFVAVGPFLTPRMMQPCNSGSAQIIFFKFSTMKEANR